MDAIVIISQLVKALEKEARRDSDGDLISPLTISTIENAKRYIMYEEAKLYSGDQIPITGDSLPNRSGYISPSRTL